MSMQSFDVPVEGTRLAPGSDLILDDFFENAPVPMHVVGADGIVIRANRAELDLLGYPAADYIGRSIAEFHVSQPAIADILARLSRGETLRNHPARLRAKDGSIRHVLLSSSGHFRDGAFLNTRCVSVDVTELERARAAATEREWHSSKILDALPVAIYTTDAAGRITYFNEAAAALWGCRPKLNSSEFCGSWKLYRTDGTPLPHDECPMAIALKEKREVRGLDAVAERPDGTRVPFAPFPTPLFRLDGELAGAVNMLVDLSDRKASEREHHLLASIVASSNDAIVSKTLDGIVSSWNAGAEKIFGYTADEMVGQSIMRLIPDDRADEERMIVDRLKKGERIEHYETIRRRKDGEHRHVSLTISPLKDGSGRIVGASKIARDITDRKKAEERMMLLAREVDHRANNMLAVVQAVFELTQAETVDALKAAMRGRIEAIGHAHKLLSGGRWEGADLRRLIEDELNPYQSAGQIRLTGQAHVLKPEVAQSVALLIHELATNAAKYGALSSPGGSLAVDWTRDGDSIRLRWTERGGPPVTAPSRNGFGTRVMERMVRSLPDGAIHFDWQGAGLICEVRVPG